MHIIYELFFSPNFDVSVIVFKILFEWIKTIKMISCTKQEGNYFTI